MPETLTESFCERCGTRYTFEAAAPRGRRLGKIKVLSKGLVNFVTNDDSSLDEAFADARSDQQRELTSHQLEAFHKTFQFCMSCRQYTCGNCWNEAEGRCLSCAPHLGQEILEAPFPDLAAATVLVPVSSGSPNGQNGHPEPIGLDTPAWPTIDLSAEGDAPELIAQPAEALPAGAPTSAADAETAAAAEADADLRAEAEAEAEAEAAAAAHAEAEAAAAAAAEAAAKASAVEAAAAEAQAAAAAEAEATALAAEADARAAAQAAAETAAAEALAAEALAAEALAAEAEAAQAAEAEAAQAAEAEAAQAAEAEAAQAAEAEAAARAAALAPAPAEEIDDDVAQAVADAERARRAVEAASAAAVATSALSAPDQAGADDDRAAAAAAKTTDLLGRFRPGRKDEPAEPRPTTDGPAEGATADLPAAATTGRPVESPAPTISLSAAALAADEAVEELRRAGFETEPALAPADETPTDEPVAAEPVVTEPVVAEPTPLAVVAEPETTPAAEPVAEPAPPISVEPTRPEPAPAAPPTPRRDDRVETPVWQIVAPEAVEPTPSVPTPMPQPAGAPQPNASVAPSNGASQGAPGSAPQWPTPTTTPPPQWPMPTSQPSPRWPAGAAAPVADMWAASSQDVLSRPGSGVSACVSCGLPLSAAARFCRRCGSAQH